MKNMAAWRERLKLVCSRFSGPSFYVDEKIPANKLRNAQQYYPLPGKGRAVALIDNTLFGSAKEGLLIGDTGLSWTRSWTAISKGKTSLTWKEFSYAEITRIGKYEINIGANNGFVITSTAFNDNDLIIMLKLIKKELLPYINTPEQIVQAVAPDSTKTSSTQTQESSAFFYGEHKPKSHETLGYQKSAAGDWPLINVHTAHIDALITLPGIGIIEANILIQNRKNGRYPRSIEELVEMLNLKPHLMSQLRERIIIPLIKNTSVSTPEQNTQKPKNQVQTQEEPQPRLRTGYRIID